jgi:hypothetical protein
VDQQPQRRNGLYRLAQPHLVGQHGRRARIQEGHPFKLIRERPAGEFQRLHAGHDLQRRLEQAIQPVFKLDQVSRRLDAGIALGWGHAPLTLGQGRRRRAHAARHSAQAGLDRR